ncbi:MAG: hypothetical protein PVJ07_05595 [Anaerolineales bacterium]
MVGFMVTVSLIAVYWRPLFIDYVHWLSSGPDLWARLDWLLLGVFVAMLLLIMVGADWKADLRIVLVGFAGGLAIESWGTQTDLWHYFTLERPPLWIIPAWPIASLAIDRLFRMLDWLYGRWMSESRSDGFFRWCYWIIFPGFLALLVSFVWPALDRPGTWLASALCLLLTAMPTDKRAAVLTFVAGSGLGYFLERWGTTRACWTYYTQQTPPLFAVLAHGMASVIFMRVVEFAKVLKPRLKRLVIRPQPK